MNFNQFHFVILISPVYSYVSTRHQEPARQQTASREHQAVECASLGHRRSCAEPTRLPPEARCAPTLQARRARLQFYSDSALYFSARSQPTSAMRRTPRRSCSSRAAAVAPASSTWCACAIADADAEALDPPVPVLVPTPSAWQRNADREALVGRCRCEYQ